MIWHVLAERNSERLTNGAYKICQKSLLKCINFVLCIMCGPTKAPLFRPRQADPIRGPSIYKNELVRTATFFGRLVELRETGQKADRTRDKTLPGWGAKKANYNFHALRLMDFYDPIKLIAPARSMQIKKKQKRRPT